MYRSRCRIAVVYTVLLLSTGAWAQSFPIKATWGPVSGDGVRDTSESATTSPEDFDPPEPPAETLAVASIEQLQNALSDAKPATLIEVADGSYRIPALMRIAVRGEQRRPVILRAKNRGKAVFTGRAGMRLVDCSFMVIEGFKFIHENRTPAVEAVNCDNVRITRNHFRLTEVDIEEEKMHWVELGGGRSHHNRIDHNLFEEKSDIGVFICLTGEKIPPRPTAHDRIDHNHFRNSGPRAENGLEAIRLGNSQLRQANAWSLVEHNLFENCDGDPEVVSVKTSSAWIRSNTLRNCQGSIVLRHGNRNLMAGNFFLRTASKRIGGIRFYGDDHVIVNNYLQDCNGVGGESGLVVPNGEINTPYGRELDELPVERFKERFRPRRVLIGHNTWVNCGPVAWEIGWNAGGKLTLPAENIVISNNLVVSDSARLILVTTPAAVKNVVFGGNILYPRGKSKLGIGKPAQQSIRMIDPKMQPLSGLFRLTAGSPAIDAATGELRLVSADMDGQPRRGARDIGADEFSNDPVSCGPLHPKDVGPDAP